MSKREKIILFAMVLAILYGGYKLFNTPFSDTGIESPRQKEARLDEFVTDIAVKLKEKDVSKTDKFIIARAKEAWAGDPFLKIGLPVASEVKQERVQASTPNMSFKYSGYMEMGRQRLAVINGMEYVVGDELEPGGYIVNSISASQVVIGIKNTNQNIILPADKMN
jgi:hypothetical protein